MYVVYVLVGIVSLVVVYLLTSNLLLSVIYLFCFIFILVITLSYLDSRREKGMERRITQDMKDEELQDVKGINAVFFRWAQKIGKAFVNWDKGFWVKYKKNISSNVICSGLKPVLKPETVMGIQVLWFIGGFLFTVWIMALMKKPFLTIAIFGIIVGALVMLFPPMNYRSYRQTREKKIFRQLPDVLDLLNLSVRAGLDFSAAVDRLITVESGPLIDEFFMAQQEIRMGKSREEAFTSMIERINFKPLTQVLRAIIQSIRMGVSLAPTLNTLSEDFKDEVSVHAEKMGAEAPVKMLIPLILFIFPTVFIVIFGPMAISMMKGKGMF